MKMPFPKIRAAPEGAFPQPARPARDYDPRARNGLRSAEHAERFIGAGRRNFAAWSFGAGWPGRRCGARTKAGIKSGTKARCKLPALKGRKRCRLHGGLSKSYRRHRHAQMKWTESRDRALGFRLRYDERRRQFREREREAAASGMSNWTGWDRLSEADRRLVIRLMASDDQSPEAIEHLCKTMDYLDLHWRP